MVILMCKERRKIMKQLKFFVMPVLLGAVFTFFLVEMTWAQGGGQGMGAQGPPKYGCQERFDAMDANKDGKLSKEEFLAAPHHRANPEQNFKAMDVNNQGYLTKDQFCSGKGRGQGAGTGQ